MPLLGGIAGFVDKYLLGYALGTAAGPALEPYAQDLANLGWRANQVKPLDAVLAAQLVAEGIWTENQSRGEGNATGWNDYKMDSLAEMARVAPGIPELLTLWRRGLIDEAAVNAGLAKLGIKAQYRGAIKGTKESPLAPADVANAVQQGFVPDAGLLPGDPGGSLPLTPGVEQVPIDTIAEFEAGGVPSGRAKVLAQLVGLPPGVAELLQMWNRGIITETAVEHGIREGHTKTKWTTALKELRHFLLSPQEVAGLRLRGWIDRPTANTLGALRGASPEVMDYLYLNRGRPATTHQVHIGYARGGTHVGSADEQEAFATAIKQSDIRPEWTDVLWAQRYSYPSAFVIRALTQSGTFDRATAHRILLEVGWPPYLADLAADAWGGTTAAGPSTKWADRARSRLFSAAHDDYLDGNADEAGARSLLQSVGATAAEQNTIIGLWNLERARTRRDLTQAQIIKLYKRSVWDRTQALAALDDLGMDPGDAADLLDA